MGHRSLALALLLALAGCAGADEGGRVFCWMTLPSPFATAIGPPKLSITTGCGSTRTPGPARPGPPIPKGGVATGSTRLGASGWPKAKPAR